jgi:bridging integrator 3
MAASQARIADTIDKFYGSADRTSEGAMAANAYKRSVDELDSSISRELVRKQILTNTRKLIAYQDAPYRTCILEPLGKMNAYFPVVNDTIAKRNKKV